MLVNLSKEEIKIILDVLQGGRINGQLKDKLQGKYDACTCKEQKEAN